MINRLRQACVALFLAVIAGSAQAEVKIAVTIAPIHSLVSMVTEGVAVPSLIVRPGASPHGYAMKPSEAAALDEADIVFWIGRPLEFWMEKAINTLASDAKVIPLGAADGVVRLGVRGGGVWDHDHGHDGHDHATDTRDLERYDPHLWLDPDNAILWVKLAAEELSSLDPDNAQAYKANAAAAEDRLVAVTSAMREELEAVRSEPYVVFHDAYQYLERYFDLNAVGAISLSDADRPSAARLTEIRHRIEESGAVCAFAEPQFEPKLLETVIQGQSVAKGILDPVGADIEPGAELYPTLMMRLASSLSACLSEGQSRTAKASKS